MAFGIGSVGAPVEWYENMGKVLRGNTNATVGEAEDGVFSVEADGDGGLMVVGEFATVLDQIGKGYFQQVFVSLHRNIVVFFDLALEDNSNTVIRVGF